MYLQGRADVWYQANIVPIASILWDGFSLALRAHFSEEVYENMVGELKKMVQTSSVAEYQNHFEELQPLMQQKIKGQDESYFINSFIGSLCDDIKHMV